MTDLEHQIELARARRNALSDALEVAREAVERLEQQCAEAEKEVDRLRAELFRRPVVRGQDDDLLGCAADLVRAEAARERLMQEGGGT
jgi:chromosome segregation ATPase